MLASLTIKNVVLIDQLTIDFRQGLCALTGETGAGKSILLDSLGLALGARADSGLVRKGEEQASVVAAFDISADHPIKSLLTENELEFDPTVILRRSVTKDGRSKAFINDQPISAGLLKQIGELLVEIHGQFDTQSLLNAQYHRGLLDEYAGNEKELSQTRQFWDDWKEIGKKLTSIKEQVGKAREDEDYYRRSLEDIDALSPQEGEEENLTTLRDKLMRREQILENLNIAENGLQEIENLSASVWKALNRLGDEGQAVISAMDRVNAEIQEVSAALGDLSSDLDSSEYSLQEIDDRLFALKAQARKHGCSIDELPQKREEIAQILDSIENQDGLLAQLIKDVEKAKTAYQAQAQKLSDSRHKTAKKLAEKIMKELPPLKLDKVRFEISVSELPEESWNENGMDKVEFLVATNPGADAGALNKIASGGELARLMLAIKVVLAEVGDAGVLVFDEVDSGIGGATAAAVGERLAKLAQHRQILVVTHSPQVAAMAQNHWIVMKDGTDSVKTNIIPLFDQPQRREEIARMLAGAEITEEARAAAGKLLEASAA